MKYGRFLGKVALASISFTNGVVAAQHAELPSGGTRLPFEETGVHSRYGLVSPSQQLKKSVDAL